jgi:DNA modification methylase
LILYGDARQVPLEDDTVDAVVTSPPYYSLRRYGGSDNEIGIGSLEEYVEDLRQVSSEVKRVLKPTGVYWLNLGDTASGSGGAGGDYNKGGARAGQPRYRQGKTGVPAMSWCLVPQRVSLALLDDGWLVRSSITWNKERMRPESLAHVRRPGVSSETILMLTQQRNYNFYPETLEDRGDVWTFPPQVARKKSHLAPFPDELARRCIEASTLPGDTVFDPFVGSGTTVHVAESLGREAIGLDLYKFEFPQLDSKS